MQRFLLYLIIILHISLTTFLFGQINPSFVRFDSPSFVSANQSFVTSIIFKIDVVTDDNIILEIEKPDKINVESATLNSWLGNKDLSIKIDMENSNHLQFSLNASSLGLDVNTPNQILLTCNSNEPTKLTNKEFKWLDLSIDKENFNIDEAKNNIEDKEISLYEIQKTAGNSIKLSNTSLLSFKIQKEEWKSIYTEFWIKTENSFNNFFSLIKGTTKDTLLTFSKNKFGFMTFPINLQETFRKDVFLGIGNWNYVGVLLINDISNSKCEVYVNSQLAYSSIIENSFDLNKINMDFANSTGKEEFELDRLKIWEFEDNISAAEKNKHFLNYEADSSKILYQTNFDNAGEFTFEYKTKELEIINNNLEFVKSNAPLFSKAPKLDVNIGSSYNSIVWYVQEFSVAEEFVIERAIGEEGYINVFTALADNDPLKIYYYTDELINENEVAFYRIKQINLDGSTVYSAEVKIGNKEIAEFSLGQNYPNPFNPLTSIYLEVIIPSEFQVKVYDLVGNTLAKLHEGYLAEGLHTFEFDGSSFPSGIYFYEVLTPRSQSVKKMILAK